MSDGPSGLDFLFAEIGLGVLNKDFVNDDRMQAEYEMQSYSIDAADWQNEFYCQPEVDFYTILMGNEEEGE